MKNIQWFGTFILLIVSPYCFSQDTEAFAKKIAKKMCKCVGTVKTYEDLKPKMEACFDSSISHAITNATPVEKGIIENPEEFKQVKERVSVLILTDCPHVKKLVEAEARANPAENAYPVNFGPDELKNATINPEKWNGEIVAFEGKIMEVRLPAENKPYMKVKLKDGQTIWVGSMVNSEFDKIGNTVRFLGYFTLTTSKDFARKYHTEPFHILVFGEVEKKSKQLAFLPGSEAQIKEWSQGKIPEGLK